jgi:hypothetical protein
MRYRDIEYSVVQGIKRGLWKWSASIAGTVVSGKEPSKAGAVVAVEKTIDRALDSKTVRLVQPPAPRRPRKVSERSGAISPTKAETVDAPTVRDYRHGPHAHLVKVTSQNGAFHAKWYAVGISRIRYAEAAVCALPEVNQTDVVAALRKLTPVEVAAIGLGPRQIVLWTNEKGVHRPDTDTSGDEA